MDGDYVTAIPEPLTYYLFQKGASHNFASRDASTAHADPQVLSVLQEFHLKKHTLRFQLTSGLADEARLTKSQQKRCAEHVRMTNAQLKNICHAVPIDHLEPTNDPIVVDGDDVPICHWSHHASLVSLDNIMSAPCKLLQSSSIFCLWQRQSYCMHMRCAQHTTSVSIEMLVGKLVVQRTSLHRCRRTTWNG